MEAYGGPFYCILQTIISLRSTKFPLEHNYTSSYSNYCTAHMGARDAQLSRDSD